MANESFATVSSHKEEPSGKSVSEIVDALVRPQRCTAITYAGQPDHLLTRCSLPAGHAQQDHIPSFSEEDKNH
jgi:hypothetical protein